MRHRKQGWKLGRTGAHRLATLRNLATSLFEHERIQTTAGRAKALRPFAERLISLAKREKLTARRQVASHLADRRVVRKLFDTLSARYHDRPGGYTRLLLLGSRFGDGAEMAQVELVGSELKIEKKEDKKRRREKPGTQAGPKGKPGSARSEAAEGARDSASAGHERTHVHPGAAKGGRRDRGTGMTKKGQ